jgi:hypothetical protein
MLKRIATFSAKSEAAPFEGSRTMIPREMILTGDAVSRDLLTSVPAKKIFLQQGLKWTFPVYKILALWFIAQ